MMGELHAFGGEKGGVGKTTYGKVLLQYCIDYNIDYKAFDTDRSAPDMKRAYERGDRVIYEAILSEASEHENAAKALFEAALTTTVLVNLSASSFAPLSAWIFNNELLDIAKESGVKFYLWFVTDGSIESVTSLYKSLTTFGADIQHIIVKNLGRNATGDWQLLDEDPNLKKLKEKYQVKELIFPKFFGNEEFKVVRDNSLGFREALSDKELNFGPIERQRVKKFLREAYAALDASGLLDHLKPKPDPESESESNSASVSQGIEPQSRYSA